MQPKREPHPVGPDGIPRAAAEQRRINAVLASAFRGADGQAALDYLRSISVDRVCGPNVRRAELTHLEGQRFIVGVISQRIAQHHRDQQHAPGRPASVPAPVATGAAAAAAKR